MAGPRRRRHRASGRMGWLSIAENEHYKLLAESNRVQMRLIPPRRGWIVDRYGKPIAINRATSASTSSPTGWSRSRDISPSSPSCSAARRRGRADHGELATPPATSRCRSPRICPTRNMRRSRCACPSCRASPPRAPSRASIPKAPAVAHLVGYVGTPRRKEYEAENKNPLLITPGFKVGKDGIEKTMEPSCAAIPAPSASR